MLRYLLHLQAHKVCPSDPLACNELGVLTYRNHQYAASERWLLRALELVPGRLHAGKLSLHARTKVLWAYSLSTVTHAQGPCNYCSRPVQFCTKLGHLVHTYMFTYACMGRLAMYAAEIADYSLETQLPSAHAVE